MTSTMGSAMPTPHKPTLGYTVVIIIGAFVVYHLLTRKR